MAPASFSFSPSQSVSERLYIPVSLKHPRLFRPSEQLSHLSKSPSPLLSRVVHQTFLPSSLAYCVTCLGEVSECVLCLGDWRKPAFQVEILTSELQRKLRELFAVGLAPARKSGAPPANSPATCPRAPRSPPRLDGSSISHSTACLWACTAEEGSTTVLTNKTAPCVFVQCSWDLAVYRCLKAHFPLKVCQCYLSLELFFFLPQR